jgi:hypothetical protein
VLLPLVFRGDRDPQSGIVYNEPGVVDGEFAPKSAPAALILIPVGRNSGVRLLERFER